MFSFLKKVSSAIRILQEKRDASARATHLMAKKGPLMTYEKAVFGQAEGEKAFPSTRFERKQMTKSFKRVALVAAAALTLGGLTGVAAHAADATVTPSATPSSTAKSFTVGNYYIIEIAASTSDKYYTITNSGGTVLYPSATPDTSTALSASNSNTELWYSGATPGAAVFGSSKTLDFSVYSATAGSQTVTVTGDSNTGAQTIAITWGAAPAFSVANSSAFISNVAPGTDDDAATHIKAGAIAAITANADVNIVHVKTTSRVGFIYLRAMNNVSTGTAIATGSFTATVSGQGLVSGRTSGTAAMSTTGLRAATSYPDSTGYAAFYVYGDNTTGTGTITVTYTDANAVTTTLATKTVIFSGSKPSSMVVSQTGNVAAAGAALGTADDGIGDGAITASLLDSNQNPVIGLDSNYGSKVSEGWYLVSDNTACITETLDGTNASVHDGSVSSADGVSNLFGTYNVQVFAAAAATSGCSANVTLHYYDATNKVDVAGTPIKFTVGGAKIYGATLTTDAASYAPGDKGTATLTLTDSKGNPVADGYYGIFYDLGKLASGAAAGVSPLTPNAAMTKVPFAISPSATAVVQKRYWVQGGVATDTFYAPYADGDVKLTGTLASTNNAGTGGGSTAANIAAALFGSSVATSFSVSTGTSLALEAATAAQDAANSAAEAADNATQAANDALAAVNSLAVQVASLVAGLKSQLTSLANLVSKISKKVGVK